MKRLILRLILACLTSFWVLPLISCQGNDKTALNHSKYVLIECENFNGVVNIEETYNYYYIEFKTSGEFALYYNMVSDNIDQVQYGSYTKTENMYIVNANGMVLNYIIINDNKLECDITITKFIFELEE